MRVLPVPFEVTASPGAVTLSPLWLLLPRRCQLSPTPATLTVMLAQPTYMPPLAGALVQVTVGQLLGGTRRDASSARKLLLSCQEGNGLCGASQGFAALATRCPATDGAEHPPHHPNLGITALPREAPDRSSLPLSQQPEEQGQPVGCPSGAAAPSRTPWHREPDPHSSHPCCQGGQGHQLPFHTREKLLYHSLRVIMASNAAGCPSPGAALCPPSRAPPRPPPGERLPGTASQDCCLPTGSSTNR